MARQARGGEWREGDPSPSKLEEGSRPMGILSLAFFCWAGFSQKQQDKRMIGKDLGTRSNEKHQRETEKGGKGSSCKRMEAKEGIHVSGSAVMSCHVHV